MIRATPAIDDLLGGRDTLRGFNVALNYNIHKYVGIKADYSLHLREDEFSRPQGSGTIDSTIQNILGGRQLKNNSTEAPRFRPFAHMLFGVAVDVDSPQLPAVFGFNDFHANETSFAMAFGGGIDIKINTASTFASYRLTGTSSNAVSSSWEWSWCQHLFRL